MKTTPLAISLLSLLVSATSAQALTYNNDFSDPASISDFSFAGVDAGDWSITGGALVDGGANTYVGATGFALLDSLTGLSKFVLDVDVKVISSHRGSDFGHAGVVWGYQDNNHYNTAYLRTHSNHFTVWDAPYNGEITTSIAGNPTNGNFYHLNLQVDHAAKFLSVTLGGATRTLNGAAYDAYAGNAPGKIGLITWGENVAYDNLRITSPVPDSSVGLLGSLALFTALASFRSLQRKR